MSDRYNSRIAKIIGWLNKAKGGFAITISATCTLYSKSEYDIHSDWRRHELVHQRQIKELGWWRFMTKYLWYSLKYGYQMNPFERSARG